MPLRWPLTAPLKNYTRIFSMALKTRYNLWKMQKDLTPDRSFKAGLFKKLSADWDNTHNVTYAWNQTLWFKRPARFASMVAMAGSLGTGAYAYTSPEVTEGSILYPIKQKLENIEERARTTPEAKAKFYLKKIERREAEREAIKKKNPIAEIATQIKKEIKREEKIKIEVAKRKIQRTEKSIERAEEQLEKTRQIMEETGSNDIKLREEVDEHLKARLNKMEKKNDKINGR